MAIGAVFGALNTMFAAVATRAREIATLRAIGFRGVPVVVAIMLETMLLALAGGILGGLLACLIFNGYTASTLAAGTTGQLMFEFHVAPSVLWIGIKWALAIGFIGGLYPALRAARLPVTTALGALTHLNNVKPAPGARVRGGHMDVILRGQHPRVNKKKNVFWCLFGVYQKGTRWPQDSGSF